MANASVDLAPLEGGRVAPGKSGDTFTSAALLYNSKIGTKYIGSDGVIYKLVKAKNASAPADGDLCVLQRSATNFGEEVDDAAAGDVGEAGVGVYVSAPAQNSFCFVAIRGGPVETKLDGSTDSIAIGDVLILGAANDLTKKVIETPTATSAGREGVAWALAASSTNEAGLVKVMLSGIGW